MANGLADRLQDIGLLLQTFTNPQAGTQLQQRLQQREQQQQLQQLGFGSPAAAYSALITGQQAPISGVGPIRQLTPEQRVRGAATLFQEGDPIGTAILQQAIEAEDPRFQQEQRLKERNLQLKEKQFEQTVKEFNRKLKQPLDAEVSFKQERQLRQEFTGLSKDFISQRDAYARIQASGNDPSAAGDLALIFNFMKVLDPGSVVRESEFDNAAQARAWLTERKEEGYRIPTFVEQGILKLDKGLELTAVQRQDFLKRGAKLFDRAQRQHDKRVKQFTGLAERAGLDVEDVVIDLGLALTPQPTVNQIAPTSPFQEEVVPPPSGFSITRVR